MTRQTPSDVTPVPLNGRTITQSLSNIWNELSGQRNMRESERRMVREYIADMISQTPTPRHSRSQVLQVVQNFYSMNSDRYNFPGDWAEGALSQIEMQARSFPRATADLANEKFHYNNDMVRYRGMAHGPDKIRMGQSLENWHRAIVNEEQRLRAINTDIFGGSQDHLLRLQPRPNHSGSRWGNTGATPHGPHANPDNAVASIVDNAAETIARRTVKMAIGSAAPIVGSGIAAHGIFNAGDARAAMNRETNNALTDISHRFGIPPGHPSYNHLQRLNQALQQLSNQIADTRSISEVVGGFPWAEIGALAGGVVGAVGGAGIGAAPGAAAGAAALTGSVLVVCSSLDLWAEGMRHQWEQMRQQYNQALEQVAREQIEARTQQQIRETQQKVWSQLRARGMPDAEIQQRLQNVNWRDVIQRANQTNPQEQLRQEIDRIQQYSPEFQRARQRLDTLDGVLDRIEGDPRIQELRRRRHHGPVSMNDDPVVRLAAADVPAHGRPLDTPVQRPDRGELNQLV